MSVLWAIALACLPGAAASADVDARPAAAAGIPSDLNSCVLCHGIPEMWSVDEQQRYLPEEYLREDIHFRAGVTCCDCHGGDRTSLDKSNAHSTEIQQTEIGIGPFRSPMSEVQKSCPRCHQEVFDELAGGVHAEQGDPRADGSPAPIACDKCHGLLKHRLYPHDDIRSPVFLRSQVYLCGKCHPEGLATYLQSVHGRGLERSGLLVTASCSDCHGAHGIHRAEKEASTLHSTTVASTCGKCHRFVEQRLNKSVHGNGPGTAEEEPQAKKKPCCTDCHFGEKGHDLPDPRSTTFRVRLGDRCGDCHDKVSRGFAQSLHGELDNLGYGPAAKCSDCHGGHDIPPIADVNSPVRRGPNRLETCRKCHPQAVENFCDFRPHADHGNVVDQPLLYWVYRATELLIYCVFAVFGLHTILWFLRSMLHVMRHGRPKRLAAGDPAYVRFQPMHRAMHAVVVVSFLGLALTGLPLKYSNQDWAQVLARVLGGFESTSGWHRICALLTIGYFTTHLLWLFGQVLERLGEKVSPLTIFFGPDSPIPSRPRDLLDMFRMLRWFAGLGPKPVFERWTYWEKFDYWAVFWAVGIIGITGMMLWFPNLFSIVLPGVALNVAKIIHSEAALLATSFIFAVHFFGTHLRPERFPMDMAILSGVIGEEEMREERPEFYERMRREGKLDGLRTTVPSRGTLRAITTAGFVAVAAGLGLLVAILLATFGDGH